MYIFRNASSRENREEREREREKKRVPAFLFFFFPSQTFTATLNNTREKRRKKRSFQKLLLLPFPGTFFSLSLSLPLPPTPLFASSPRAQSALSDQNSSSNERLSLSLVGAREEEEAAALVSFIATKSFLDGKKISIGSPHPPTKVSIDEATVTRRA